MAGSHGWQSWQSWQEVITTVKAGQGHEAQLSSGVSLFARLYAQASKIIGVAQHPPLNQHGQAFLHIQQGLLVTLSTASQPSAWGLFMLRRWGHAQVLPASVEDTLLGSATTPFSLFHKGFTASIEVTY